MRLLHARGKLPCGKHPDGPVGDGTLGFRAALDEIFRATRKQRCWVHKTDNVLNYLPKSVQARAKQGLHENWMAETRKDVEEAFNPNNAQMKRGKPL